MSCPIPVRIINPHYKKIASLSDNPDAELESYSNRNDFYIDVPCGVCYHCRKSYKTSWTLRLQHHFKYLTKEQRNNSYFVTLTFDNANLPDERPTKKQVSPYIRQFLERVRYEYGHSFVHWIVSEYGSNTERFHLHGIFFDPPFPIWYLDHYWKYGFVSYRRLNQRRITYVTTYVNKQIKGLIEEPNKRQYVWCSPGIGKKFTEDPLNVSYARQHGSCVPFIYYNNRPFAMPRYYRGKIFTEDEREDMKENYFFFLSDDVIPPPPYYLGTRRYDDYTLYLADVQKLRLLYNNKYRKYTNYGKQQFKSDFEIT